VIDRARLEELLGRFPDLTIGLVGDLFLDLYLDLVPGAHELSIETNLEAYQVDHVRNQPGALGTVMNNLAALGVGRLVPVTVIGDDGHGYDLLKELRRLPVDAKYVIQDANRLTPTYTKPLRPQEDGSRVELNRLDVRTREPLSAATNDRLIRHLESAQAETEGMIVLDQIAVAEQGVVNAATRTALSELAKNNSEYLIFVDSRAKIGEFHFGTLKPNLPECLAALGREPTEDIDRAQQAAVELSERTGRPLFCTLGERGMLVVRPGATPVEVPSFPVTGPIDIVGAGDNATSGVVAALLAGASDVEAAEVGNLVASVTVQKLGTTGTATPQELLARWDEIDAG